MPWLPKLLPALQSLDPKPDRILFIDSSSIDGTPDFISNAGFELHSIAKGEFGHGKTRNLGARLCEGADVLIYLTQDAIPASTDCIAPLLNTFAQDEQTAVVFGRQLPHTDSTVSAAYARLHNYPEQGYTNTAQDIPSRGIKAVFCSNSFAAYRADALAQIGGFPEDLPLAEDMAVCGRLLEAGHTSHYLAKATVFHSHNYTPAQEFTRYFDIGALLKVDPWFSSRSLRSGGEGLRFVLGELRYTLKHGTLLDACSILPRTAAKFIGFKLGQYCHILPLWLVRRFSMHSYYWKKV